MVRNFATNIGSNGKGKPFKEGTEPPKTKGGGLR